MVGTPSLHTPQPPAMGGGHLSAPPTPRGLWGAQGATSKKYFIVLGGMWGWVPCQWCHPTPLGVEDIGGGWVRTAPHPPSSVLSSYSFLLPHLAILLLMGIFWKRLDFM